MESIKISQSLATPLLDQAVLVEYMLTDGLPPHLRKLRERLSAQLPHAMTAVQRYFPMGAKVISTAGGWWLWLALPEPIDTVVLLKASVAQGVAFTPGGLFSGEGRFGNHVRINIGRPWSQEMDDGFRTVGELACRQLKDLGERGR
jgi:DNA-binding transcriptional MocR family regulator